MTTESATGASRATAPRADIGSQVSTGRSMPVRVRTVLRARGVWIFPLAVPTVLVVLMTFIYIGSVLNPPAHLHGLPIVVVNQDAGATVNGHRVDEGSTVVRGLDTTAVTSRLDVLTATLAQAQAEMDRGGAYLTVVIPPGFTDSLLGAAGLAPASPAPHSSSAPTVHLLENVRLGSLGVNLAAGVITPALQQVSTAIGGQLVAESTAAARGTSFALAQLHNPLRLETAHYRPLPPNTALGLSAFYVALLAMMAGFVGATIVNASLDGVLGYSTTELGPRWRQRRPVAITRRQTFVLKWSVAVVAVPLLDAAIIGAAAGILRMDAPNTLLLWAVLALASMMVASVTLTLFAAFGSIGQLLGLLVLVYLSLASSGGTIPTQALPGFYNVVGHVEPLRQALTATRAVLYFGAQSGTGLTHALVVLASEVVLATAIGLAVTGWYDHRRLFRLPPELIAFVSRVVDERLASSPPEGATAHS